MKNLRVLLFLLLLLCNFKHVIANDLFTEIPQTGPNLIVSLGSHCEVAAYLRQAGLRSEAYPFDWLTTFDHTLFASLIYNDFAYFMDARFLYQYPYGNVVNWCYQIDFRHDWPYSDINFAKYFPEIRKKYERRIERFRKLNRHYGKVYFVRAAYDLNLDPFLPTVTSQCTRIEISDAEILRNTLYEKFPNLDFTLVIVNYIEEETPDIIGLEKVIEFKVRKGYRTEDYSRLFQLLKNGQL